MAWLLHTSGSSGTPKGVLLTQRNRLAPVAAGLVGVLRMAPQDRLHATDREGRPGRTRRTVRRARGPRPPARRGAAGGAPRLRWNGAPAALLPGAELALRT
ncbi:hypothetical protein, partial [Streptomyces sp. SID12501]|uniref:hypothetical protein n=1 Tax=Streptomyces sp. SID12501 TaxID=2706042 RepID=UPI0031BA8BE7